MLLLDRKVRRDESPSVELVDQEQVRSGASGRSQHDRQPEMKTPSGRKEHNNGYVSHVMHRSGQVTGVAHRSCMDR